MVVPTGTASPWRELPRQGDACLPDTIHYMRDGWVTGSADLLAEAVRADGVVRTLGLALRFAEEAVLEPGWYGYVDGGLDEVLCTDVGETNDGNVVDRPRACLIAAINVKE